MKYSDCIATTMATINYLLENGWSLSNKDNLNYMNLKLSERGFVLEEESRFDTDLTYGTEQVALSPSYVVGMLFNGGYDENYGEKKSHAVTDIVRQLPNWDLQKPISYIELVHLIDRMRNKYSTGKIDSTSTIDMDYLRFKKMISQVKRDEYVTLKNQILSLGNLDYETLTNIRVTKPAIARKIERLYQVELLLERYSKTKILEEAGKIDLDYDEYYDYYEMLDGVDLLKHSVSWEEFCDLVKYANDEEKKKATDYWQRNSGYSNPKLTALGLDEMPLPGSPNVYKRFSK